jgi:L-amino acid N-acyltransferase YncA
MRLKTTMHYRFEPMTVDHREAVMGIYNHHVANSFAAFPDTPMPLDFFDKMMEMVKGCGCIRRVGRKFGQDFDVVWLQRHLGG